MNRQKIDDLFFSGKDVINLTLSSLRGSQGLHLVLANDNGETIRRAEIETSANETIDVQVTHCNHVLTLATSKQHTIRYLPNDQKYNSVNAFKPKLDTQKLDILILIDATMRQDNQFSIESEPFIHSLNEKLQNFIESLHEKHSEINLSLMLFGDKKILHIDKDTLDLSPKNIYDYPLGTEEFIPWNKDELEESLKNLKGIHGADYIDALAESLEKINTSERYWRNDARRLLLVIGNSPGFSLLNPAPLVNGIGFNAAIRHCDVESQTKALHKQEVEIITLYVKESSEIRGDFKSIVDYTQKQYKNLASTDEHSHLLNTWNIEQTVLMLSTNENDIGYGYCVSSTIKP